MAWPVIVGVFLLVALTIIAALVIHASIEKQERELKAQLERERRDYDEVMTYVEADAADVEVDADE